MRDPITGKSIRGKRGGSRSNRARLRDIHSKLDGRPSGTHSNHSHDTRSKSNFVLATGAAKYHECAAIEETAETHVVPLQSLTRKQLLGVFPQRLETEPMQAKQLDKRVYDGKAETVEAAMQQAGMVETSDNRLVWKSDRTLLIKGNPFGEIGQYRREGSVSVGLDKRKTVTAILGDEKFNPDGEVIGIALGDETVFDEPTLTDDEIAKALDTK